MSIVFFLRVQGFDDFGYFRFFEPTRVIGHSIGLYELTQVDIARLRRTQARPAAIETYGVRQP